MSVSSVGLASTLGIFLSSRYRRGYRTHLMWHPRWAVLWKEIENG